MVDGTEVSRDRHTSRACQNCSRAKAKCVPQLQTSATDARCARCSRLDKECGVVPRAVRKKRAPNVATTTAKLEQKIESLVTLLSNAQGVNLNLDQLTPPESVVHTGEQPPLPRPPPPTSHSLQTNLATSWNTTLPDHTWKPQPQPGPPNPPTPIEFAGQQGPMFSYSNLPLPPKQHFVNDLWTLDDKVGENLVTKFREYFLDHFPFIIVPSHLALQELRDQRPYVLKAMWTIAFQDSRMRQIEMSKDLMTDISISMLIRGERGHDMLQCLILLNAWAYFISPVPPSSKSSGLFQLCLGLLFDLKLTRPIKDYDGPGAMLADCQTRNIPDSLANDTAKRTSDDCRSLLCCYFLGSVYSLSVKRTEGLRYTAYIEFCCQTLEDRAEYESDILLAALVRIECIIRPIDNLLTRSTFNGDHNAPVSMHVKAVDAQLQQFYKSLAPNIQQHPLLKLSYDSNCVFVFEPSLYKQLFPTTSSTCDPTHRLNLLHSCMTSCKKLLDGYVSVPLSNCYGISVADLAPVGRGLSSLLKLCTIDEPGWDLPSIYRTANLSYYFETLLARFSAIGTDLDGRQGEPCRQSFFTGCARAITVVRNWYETKLGSEGGMNYQAASIAYDGMMNGEPASFLDDSYWLDFMGDWTSQL